MYTPKTPSAPAVLATGVTNLSSESAEFTAEINPDGAATEYTFEYGRCPTVSTCPSTFEASVPRPDEFVGSDFNPHKVGPVRALGLTAGAVYHVLVRAHNRIAGKEEITNGPARIFTTQIPGLFALADGRQWELVSPADKHGAPIEGIGEKRLIQAAANGNAITYLAFAPVEGEPVGNAGPTQILSTRQAEGWTSRELAVAHEQASGSASAAGLGEENVFFSPDLSTAVLQPAGAYVPCQGAGGAPQPCLSEAASEQTPFLHSIFPAGNPAAPCTSGCFIPLVSGCPAEGECATPVRENADVPAGTVFGQIGEHGSPCPPEVVCGPRFEGASPDAQHVIIQSSVGLTSNSPKTNELYEWNANAAPGQRLSLVSVLPANGSGEELPAPTAALPLGWGGIHRAAGAVSDDGSRVVFESARRLFLRDTALGRTVELDLPEAGCGVVCKNGGGEGSFQFMNGEGTRVFFTDPHKLTADSGAKITTEIEEPGEPEDNEYSDLYECRIVEEAGMPVCVLSDLTPRG